MASINKILTTADKSVTIAAAATRGTISFVDEKGSSAGQCNITIQNGKVVETGQAVSKELATALATVASEFSALVDGMVSAGSLDPLSRRRPGGPV